MYSIIRNVTTKQMHIFEGKEESGGSVTLNQKSICQICSKDDSISAIGLGFNVNEQEIRDISASLARGVCGICVSHFYGDF